MRRLVFVLALLGATVAWGGVVRASEPPAPGECPAGSASGGVPGDPDCYYFGCDTTTPGGTPVRPVVREWDLGAGTYEDFPVDCRPCVYPDDHQKPLPCEIEDMAVVDGATTESRLAPVEATPSFTG